MSKRKESCVETQLQPRKKPKKIWGPARVMKLYTSDMNDQYNVEMLGPGDNPDNPVTIKKLLRFENFLRTSKSVQSKFKDATYEDDWIEMVNDLTFRCAVEFSGADPKDVDNYIAVMRTAATRWPMDAEFRSISLWRKYNRARNVDFKLGDLAPEAFVLQVEKDGELGERLPLFDAMDSVPLIVVSSSAT